MKKYTVTEYDKNDIDELKNMSLSRVIEVLDAI